MTLDTAASRVGRPSKTEAFEVFVRKLLEAEPHLKSVEILRRCRNRGYGGGRYDLVRRVRPVPKRPLVRFEGLPGEFSQHDFGEVRVCYLNGREEKVTFFASRLKWSRFAGIPLRCVFDRPRTIASGLKRDGSLKLTRLSGQ